MSGSDKDVATMLYDEQILFDVMRDPLQISSTVKIDDVINDINYSYSKIMSSINKDTLKSTYERLKIGVLDYFNLSYSDDSYSADNISNLYDNVRAHSNNDTLIVTTTRSNYPIDCVFVYKADNSSNSYEISVCLESDFFMNKKKWDGGNDDVRYEVGSDLRLDTRIIVQENGKITSSENSSIFK
tara:strand:- start:9 stop:563 length:555 start_codon:yes stop_codon:yes gene_type:complete